MPDETKSTVTLEQPTTPSASTEQTERIERVADVPVEQIIAPVIETALPVSVPAPVSTAPASSPAPTPRERDPLTKEVENILSENIAEIYKKLPENKKALFRQTGEHVAAQIAQMIKSGIMQIKKILKWIYQWLKIIPGVNEFFLEQEAKIKSDKMQVLFVREHAPL